MTGYLHSKLGRIGDLLRDPAMIEVSFNGDGRIWTERAGEAVMTEAWVPGLDPLYARDLAMQIANDQSLALSDMAPMISASVAFEGINLRCQAIVPPASASGTVISIRVFRARASGSEPHRFGLLRDVGRSLEDERADILGRLKAGLRLGSEDELDAFCREVVSQRLNVLISGITSGGKTELSRRLLWMVKPDQRLALIQDANELLPDLPNVVNLIADRKESSPRSADKLLEATLRLRPDRIIVGELRGIEAITFLEAINTGHEGSFTTIHAHSARKALDRLAFMVSKGGLGMTYAEIHRYVRNAIDVVIQVGRSGDRRGVMEIWMPALDDHSAASVAG